MPASFVAGQGFSMNNRYASIPNKIIVGIIFIVCIYYMHKLGVDIVLWLVVVIPFAFILGFDFEKYLWRKSCQN